MELILVVVISAGMAENSQNGVSRSLRKSNHCVFSYSQYLLNNDDTRYGSHEGYGRL